MNDNRPIVVSDIIIIVFIICVMAAVIAGGAGYGIQRYENSIINQEKVG